jgi:hypothetical protein
MKEIYAVDFALPAGTSLNDDSFPSPTRINFRHRISQKRKPTKSATVLLTKQATVLLVPLLVLLEWSIDVTTCSSGLGLFSAEEK